MAPPPLDPERVRARREQRWAFLLRLYEAAEEAGAPYVDGWELAADLGLDRAAAERIARYLEDHGFVKNTSGNDLVLRITARGIDHVERRFLRSG
jgi:DNA-binding MarR family transcriptional regulator